jgi:hypothetical protein
MGWVKEWSWLERVMCSLSEEERLKGMESSPAVLEITVGKGEGSGCMGMPFMQQDNLNKI